MRGNCMPFFLHNSPAHALRVMMAACILLLSSFLSAQSPAFYRYGKESGLPSEEIYEVKQDRFGFIWIASDRGVFRYDGYNFQPFTTAQGLTDNTVFRMYEDFRGRMWLMPFNGELCYVENDKVIAYQYNDTISKYITGLRVIRSMEVKEDGTLRIGMLLEGLAEISASGKLSRIDLAGTEKTSELYWVNKNARGVLLMGSALGSIPRSNFGISYTDDSHHNFQPLGKENYRSLLSAVSSTSGVVYFGVGDKLYCIAADGTIQSHQLPGYIVCLTEDSRGGLWIGTYGSGLLKYPPGTTSFESGYSVFYEGEIITSVVEDRDNSFWVATHHNGLLYIPNTGVRYWSLFDDDESCDLLPDANGKMYVLWRDHGLSSISGNSITHHQLEDSVGVFRALSWNSHKSQVLVGSNWGAYEYDPVSQKYHLLIRRTVNSITSASDRTFIGTAWYLLCVRGELSSYIVGGEKIRHRPDVLLTDHAGTVWVGALDGLYKVADTSLESQSGVHDLFHHRIAGMCEMKDHTLVVATQSNGIAFLLNGRVRSLTQTDDFPCDHIYGVTEGDDHILWCSTNAGLFRISVTEQEITFESITEIQSVLGTVGKPCFVPQTHELWLCNGNRVISFDPSSLQKSDNPPPIYIQQVQSGDSLFSTADTVQLAHDENSLRISYCGIAYRLQGHVPYRYRLSGHADEWQNTEQNTVEFVALEPGDYTFEVQAQNENGVWSVSPATFSFVIVPAFWETGWFLAAIIVVGGLLMYLLLMLRFRTIRRRDLLREQALIFRQQALASQMNPHFVFNALNTIQSLVLKENKTKALDMFSAFATLLRKSLKHAGERYIPLTEEINTLNLYFELETMRFGDRLNYQISIASKVDIDLLGVPAMLIQPLVENAIVHGIREKPDGGTVNVHFAWKENVLICEVEDDGLGRRPKGETSGKHNGAGMSITKDRLEVLAQMNKKQYNFAVIDKTDSVTGKAIGTLIRLTIPHLLLKSEKP